MDTQKYKYIGIAFKRDSKVEMGIVKELERIAAENKRSLTYTIKELLGSLTHPNGTPPSE